MGSRLVITASSSRPSSFLRTAWRKAAWLGSNRRLKPIWTDAPDSATIARHASTRSMSRWIGFSHRMALPACAARSIRSQCVSVEVAISTAWTDSSASAASTESKALVSVRSAARAAAAVSTS